MGPKVSFSLFLRIKLSTFYRKRQELKKQKEEEKKKEFEELLKQQEKNIKIPSFKLSSRQSSKTSYKSDTVTPSSRNQTVFGEMSIKLAQNKSGI